MSNGALCHPVVKSYLQLGNLFCVNVSLIVLTFVVSLRYPRMDKPVYRMAVPSATFLSSFPSSATSNNNNIENSKTIEIHAIEDYTAADNLTKNNNNALAKTGKGAGGPNAAKSLFMKPQKPSVFYPHGLPIEDAKTDTSVIAKIVARAEMKKEIEKMKTNGLVAKSDRVVESSALNNVTLDESATREVFNDSNSVLVDPSTAITPGFAHNRDNNPRSATIVNE
jgi:hypothetical protein